MKIPIILLCFAIFHNSKCEIVPLKHVDFDNEPKFDLPFNCSLSQEIIDEIASYEEVANRIMDAVLNGAFKGETYKQLQMFVDQYPHRLSGSEQLEDSIDYFLDIMTKIKLDNVRGEPAPVPKWTRGEETGEMILPRRQKIPIMAYGMSIGTPEEGITADVIVVKNFEELLDKAEEAKDKIVIYNQDYFGYGASNQYRGYGATEAAKVGAVAALVRSITPFSLYTLHTGYTVYGNESLKIPCGAITVEDAELLYRIYNRGERIQMKITMGAQLHEPSISRNAIGDFIGDEKPDEFVIVSGHIDNWDIGTGPLDDAGGVFISYEAVALLKALGLRPKRTLQVIGWTVEEFGLYGAKQHREDHLDEYSKIVAAFNSDVGTFKPTGLDFAGSDEAACIVEQILTLLEPLNATMFRKFPIVGTDIWYMLETGVPGVSLNTTETEPPTFIPTNPPFSRIPNYDSYKFFWYHHSGADTMTMMNSRDLDLCTAVWAVASYVIADMKEALPR